MENKNGVQILAPIASVGFAVDSHKKQQLFSEKVVAQNTSMGKDLTDYLVHALEGAGYQVVLLDNVNRPVEDPEDIELAKIDTDAEAILQVYFDNVGLFSSSFSTDYLPRVDIRATLYSPQRKDELYDETLNYGVDASAGEPTSIVANPKFAYPSFDNVMMRVPEITAVFATGTQAIGERLVEQIKAVLK
ncbi:MAG TPA: hypothetical protein VLC91_15525 [Spongiibacteraceae bacterium]|nr:hypothetical protein [Spongiibacteraceae bacterium]